MVLKIKMVSDEVDGFLREFEIDSEATFLDLCKVILESCGYPDDQMTSFYLCNDEWERGEQITREDMGTTTADTDLFVMGDTRLSEFLEDKGQKLEFVFDPFSERSFFLNVREIITGTSLKRAQVKRLRGDAPAHIAELASVSPVIQKVTPISEDEDELFSATDFDDEDFDPEGFEISQTPY
ncbi:MAG: hypothetical protein IJ786_00780 [Bacteroidaceae bacterium]|nr:hypothetical protein [Bacteroidaceae bacterium]